jgi:NitT/TauT family transport system ATP-binding protein
MAASVPFVGNKISFGLTGGRVIMSETLIEVQGVYKDFEIRAGATTTILEDIKINVTEGEFLAILGPSGAGKSTLLRIIAGLVPASKGRVLYRGQPFEGVNPGIALVFQSFALFPWLTVLENILLGLESSHISGDEKHDKARTVIDMVGLIGFESSYPKEISGGMRQRVGIGRALVSNPDVLLMDEPFSALDVLTAENLRSDLMKLWLEKKIPTKAIILVTHGIEEAVFMADRAIILSTGPARIIQDMAIEIPRQRDRKSPAFLDLVDNIYNLLMHKDADIIPPGKTKEKELITIPPVPVGALSGFLELIADLNEKTDLYKLAARFGMDIKEFFPIVEVATLLGMAVVTNGDLETTPVGLQFAHASEYRRKELFKGQLLANVPFLRQMLDIIESKTNKRMNIEFFEETLRQHFSEAEAKKELAVFLSWGRYAGLFKYDRHKKEVYTLFPH